MRSPGKPPTHSQRRGGSHTDILNVLRPNPLIRSAPLEVGPSGPSGDTVTARMWGAHSGHLRTSMIRSQARRDGASTSKVRSTAGVDIRNEGSSRAGLAGVAVTGLEPLLQVSI